MNAPDAQDGAPVRFGIILLPDFTLTAFSGLVDVLRLASDEGDNSRPRRCSWEILGENPQPVRASCGVQIAPWSLFGRPDAYDYLVVVGGLLRATPEISKATLDFIRAAGGSRTTLVGVHRRLRADARRRAGRAPGLRQLVPLLGFPGTIPAGRRQSAGGRPALCRGPPPHHLLGRPRFHRRGGGDPGAPRPAGRRAEGAAHPAGRRTRALQRAAAAAASARGRAVQPSQGQARDPAHGAAPESGVDGGSVGEETRHVGAAA